MSLVLSIEKLIRKMPSITTECSIYRVPKRLVDINPRTYTPQIISIGPFHHGRQNLLAMEQHKLRFLNGYLRRITKSVEAVVEMARNWEEEARHCYAEPINMNSDEFVKMMLVDGCFIVEFMLIVYYNFTQTQIGLDPSFYKAIIIDLYRDLTMLENQLPFFVLQRLFDKFSPPTKISLEEVTHNFFSIGLIKPKPCELPHNVFQQKTNHLVDFLSFYYAPSTLPAARGNSGSEKKLLLPPTATELWEAGVIFESETEKKGIIDISFEKGVLKIPPFEIHDAFETYLRNLMAFEHYRVGNRNQRYAIQYVVFLDGLINTEKDVSLLVKAGIITNYIGGCDGEVSKLFNDLSKDIAIADDFYFQSLCEDLRNHCRTPWHQWMASLRRDYFNSPWASISFVAATCLIVLTLVQTILSAISLSE